MDVLSPNGATHANGNQTRTPGMETRPKIPIRHIPPPWIGESNHPTRMDWVEKLLRRMHFEAVEGDLTAVLSMVRIAQLRNMLGSSIYKQVVGNCMGSMGT